MEFVTMSEQPTYEFSPNDEISVKDISDILKIFRFKIRGEEIFNQLSESAKLQFTKIGQPAE